MKPPPDTFKEDGRRFYICNHSPEWQSGSRPKIPRKRPPLGKRRLPSFAEIRTETHGRAAQDRRVFLNDETGSLLFYRQKFAAIPRA